MPSASRDRGPNWRRVRRAVLERDQGQCQLKLMGVCTTTATVVHHTIGQELTGNDPAALVASCAECNSRIGRPDLSQPEPRRTTKW
jgi:5-methylcytosine-specific restriction endonuclease McrA